MKTIALILMLAGSLRAETVLTSTESLKDTENTKWLSDLWQPVGTEFYYWVKSTETAIIEPLRFSSYTYQMSWAYTWQKWEKRYFEIVKTECFEWEPGMVLTSYPPIYPPCLAERVYFKDGRMAWRKVPQPILDLPLKRKVQP